MRVSIIVKLEYLQKKKVGNKAQKSGYQLPTSDNWNASLGS